jgi:hypothetical protein
MKCSLFVTTNIVFIALLVSDEYYSLNFVGEQLKNMNFDKICVTYVL